MNQSGINPGSREIARQLLTYETQTRQSSSGKMPAAVEVCDKLRYPLTTLMGSTAFRSLLERALTLAKREAEGLEAVNVKENGSMEGLNGDSDGAGLAIVASLVALLVTFIGEALTFRLLNDVWPALATGESNLREKDQ